MAPVAVAEYKDFEIVITADGEKYFAQVIRSPVGESNRCSINLPLRLQNRWNPGDRILIVHDALNPSRHDADIFDVRRDELEMLQQRNSS